MIFIAENTMDTSVALVEVLQGGRGETVLRRGLCLFLVVSILIGCTAVSVVSSAASYGEVGVQAGQWAEYTCAWTLNNITYRQCIEITGVVGSTVHFNFTEFVGDQVHEYQWTANLSSGSFWIFLVMPHLGAGDPLWPGSGLRINGTMTMLVMGLERSVAYIEVHYYDYLGRTWYDVDTGLRVKSETWRKWGYWENLTLTSSNIFGSQSSSHGDSVLNAIIVALGVGAVAAVFAVAARDATRRRR